MAPKNFVKGGCLAKPYDFATCISYTQINLTRYLDDFWRDFFDPFWMSQKLTNLTKMGKKFLQTHFNNFDQG